MKAGLTHRGRRKKVTDVQAPLRSERKREGEGAEQAATWAAVSRLLRRRAGPSDVSWAQRKREESKGQAKELGPEMGQCLSRHGRGKESKLGCI